MIHPHDAVVLVADLKRYVSRAAEGRHGEDKDRHADEPHADARGGALLHAQLLHHSNRQFRFSSNHRNMIRDLDSTTYKVIGL
jgi:hypothetical protein